MTIENCPVDIVIPFVDHRDPIWQESLTSRGGCIDDSIFRGILRYRDTGTFKLVLDGIKEFLPWYNKIYLIVSHPSQVPEYAKDCEIILHEDFIPKEFNPPVFSSCAIETWMGNWNVGEYFIYFNDDVIPIKPMSKSDFLKMTNNGDIVPRNLINIVSGLFPVKWGASCMMMNTFSLITGIYGTRQGVSTEHGPTVFKSSWCKECLERYYNELHSSCNPLTRTENDMCQWTYLFYQMMYHQNDQYSRPGYYLNGNRYLDIPPEQLLEELTTKEYKWVCLNDSISVDISPWIKVVEDILKDSVM